MCGNQDMGNKVKPLITVEELKVMKAFEAIVLIPRMMPYRTNLLPDYKMDWNLESKKEKIEKRQNKEIKIFNL